MSILTGRVIFGELFWVKQVWEVLIFLFSFSRERRAGIRHSGIWSELGRPLVWVAEVNRWAAGVIGNLLALERALRMRSVRCEQHVKVGVQGSGFAWLVV